MKGRYLQSSGDSFLKGNIYADKSSLILNWLLGVGVSVESFSVREVAQELGVSVGLVQKVFANLVYDGILGTKGVRTAKRFTLMKPQLLLENWISNYSIVNKCKMSTYRSGYGNTKELLKVLKGSSFSKKIALALHSAAKALGFKNTNLDTLELYLMDPGVKSQLEDLMKLEPQERGYEVLLVEPYYKSLLKKSLKVEGIHVCSPLLTFLDLYHYPLRGLEQAEFLAERVPELKKLQ